MKTEKETKWEQSKIKDYNFTKLKDHDIEKKVIKSAFSKLWTLGGWYKTVSWIDQKIAEMLWVILLRNQLEQTEFIYMFRSILAYWGKNGITDISHSWLGKYNHDLIKKNIIELCCTPKIKVILKPLLLFWEDLPLFDVWKNAINLELDHNDELALAEAVEKVFFHQSQEATDCRWVRVYLEVMCWKISFAEWQKHILDNILDYPFSWDMESVRSIIRTIEMPIDIVQNKEKDNIWNNTFWEMCLVSSSCLTPKKHQININKSMLLVDIKNLNKEIFHIFMSNTTPWIDFKLDTIIGISIYSLNILEDLCKSDNACNSLSRIALRTMVEIYINLSFLIQKNSDELWKAFRNYGNWETKKAFLKLCETSNLPSFIKLNTLHSIANEDIWQEYLDIKIWDWNNSNLRNRADESWTKEIYDNFYDLTSWYTHWNWWAIKEQVYNVCLNPLHKYHRIPKAQDKEEYTVIMDAIYLVNLTLEQVSNIYWPLKNILEKDKYIKV